MQLIQQFGKKPNAQRRAAFAQLDNYSKGQFQNLLHTPPIAEGEHMLKLLWDFFQKHPNTTPLQPLPFVQTNLATLPLHKAALVWFGHSSYYFQTAGLRFLVDPVFSGQASPISGSVKAFAGTNHYQATDMPDIDVLLISHDHWDHLDYATIQQLQPKVHQVICGLGVADHFLYWGWPAEKIIERNWYDAMDLPNGCKLTLMPARHFSGRTLQRNTSLFTSYVLQTPQQQLFIGGDSGYGTHFKAIGERFGAFDWAILECGQYNEKWPYIHSMPAELMLEMKDLNAKHCLPVHHSKFKLALHAWYEPLEQLSVLAAEHQIALATPKIGEPVWLDAPAQSWEQWWKPLM